MPRDEFSDDEYQNGETSELAARGLYGDYALCIPAELISTVLEPAKAHGEERSRRTPGLKLDAIDDTLLRIDFVFVAR